MLAVVAGRSATNVLETRQQIVVTVIDGQQDGSAGPEVFSDYGAIHLLSDAAAQRVVDIGNSGDSMHIS